jgi:hypothetical protein
VANGSHHITVFAFGPGGTRLDTDSTTVMVSNWAANDVSMLGR